MVDDKAVSEQITNRGLAEWFKEAWSQALLKVGAAEEEAGKVLHRVGDLAGWKPEDVKRIAKEFGDRLLAQRRDFERTLDEQITRAVSRVKVPRREEIEVLKARVERLTARIEEIQSRRGLGP